MKILKHLKADWFRYGFETIAVIVGILVAFALDNWNETRHFKHQLSNYSEKLINDLVLDTLNIQELIGDAHHMQNKIEANFEYFFDMHSSGKIELLNEELRKALIELTNEQEFLMIIIEKTIDDIKEQQYEMKKYFDSDLSESDFFEKLSWVQGVDKKRQGLLHRHNELTQFHRLAYFMESRGNNIIDQTKYCLELLNNSMN